MLIYLIVNSLNAKQYIGQTILSLEERKDWFQVNIKYQRDGYYPIVAAMRKYGFERFDFCVQKKCFTQVELDFWERYYIKKLNTKVPQGYNVQDGGRNVYRPTRDDVRRALRESFILERYTDLQAQRSREQESELGDLLMWVENASLGDEVHG